MVETNNMTANKFDTLQKARRDLIGEIEAIIQYDEHAQSATDPLSKQTWLNIKEEELVHVGELMGLINHIDPSQLKFIEEGVKEFEERLKNNSGTNSQSQTSRFENNTNNTRNFSNAFNFFKKN